ncbi:MAG: hypothetical protein R6X02_32690 [Enhygromyxa sp.]
MAYDARKKEVMDLIAAADFGDAPQGEVELLGRVVTTYFNRRVHHLKQILDVLPPGRSTPSFKVWLDRAMTAIKMVHDTFDDVPESTRHVVAGIASEEHKFFHAIYRCVVAKWRDKMVEQSKALEQAKAEFENKWKEMLRRDNDLESKMKRVGAQFEDILAKAAKAAAEAEKTTKEKVADAVHKTVGGALRAVDLGVTEQAIKLATRAIKGYVSEIEARKLEIMVLLSLENQVFATFKMGRKAVDEFLDQNGYPQIKDAWDEGDDAIEAIVGRMVTAGQKTDAAEFVKAVKDQLAKVFKLAETSYKDFAKKHEYLFFGPLGADWHRQLGEGDLWKDFSKDWEKGRKDFDDLLRDSSLAVRRGEAFGVDLDELTDEQYKDFERRMTAHSRELLAAWNQLKGVARSAATELIKGHENTKRVLDSMR